MSWTIWWDMHRRPGKEGRNRAMEKTEGAAMQRAQRFLKLGFVVYEIRAPDGAVFMDEAQIARSFGMASADAGGGVVRTTVTELFHCARSRSD